MLCHSPHADLYFSCSSSCLWPKCWIPSTAAGVPSTAAGIPSTHTRLCASSSCSTSYYQRCCSGPAGTFPADDHYPAGTSRESEPYSSLDHNTPFLAMGVCLDDPLLHLWMLNLNLNMLNILFLLTCRFLYHFWAHLTCRWLFMCYVMIHLWYYY